MNLIYELPESDVVHGSVHEVVSLNYVLGSFLFVHM